MNNDNPLIPQGSLLEQKTESRARVKILVFFVLAVHAVGLMALLMQGCKREEPLIAEPAGDTNAYAFPPFEEDTNAYLLETNISMVATSTPPPALPETTLPPVAPPTANATVYEVAKGDSFSTIAKKFGVSVRAIQDANPTVVPTRLQIGQKLQIPAPAGAPATTESAPTVPGSAETIHVVKSGENLTRIAAKYNTTVKAIRSENNLRTDNIKVGQKLRIPGGVPTAGAVPAQ